MAAVFNGEMDFRSGEGPNYGHPISIVLEPQSKPPIMGISQIRLRASAGVTLQQIDALAKQMGQLLSGEVSIQLED